MRRTSTIAPQSRVRRERWLLMQVVPLLAISRAAVAIVPFRWIARGLGRAETESDHDVSEATLHEAQRIAWAIRAVERRLHPVSTCFSQALTAWFLLRRRGIASTLYLGAAFTPDREGLHAHAWLRCGPLYVTGGRGDRDFGTVARFGGEARRPRTLERSHAPRDETSSR